MDRPRNLSALTAALRRAPVVAILGPRQIGKTTLAGTLARFLVLGSAASDLLRQSSESLAGRFHYHELTPLRLDVIHAGEQTYPMAERVRAVALSRLLTDLESL